MNEEKINIWRRAFTAAKRLTRAAPWKSLSNSDIVKLNVHDTDVYVMVLGNGGQMYGCTIFVGEEGYKNLFKTYCGYDPALKFVEMDSAVLQDAIVLDLYSESEYIYPEQMELLKLFNMTDAFRFPRLPFFEHYLPYRYARKCTMEEISLAADTINELVNYADLFTDPPEQYYFGGFHLFTYDDASQKMVKTTVMAPGELFDDGPHGSLTEEELEQLSSAPWLDRNVEMEVITSCAISNNKDTHEQEFVRFVTLAIENGKVYDSTSLIGLKPAGPAVAKMLIDFIKEKGRPKEIHVRNCIVQKHVDAIAAPLGIKTKIKFMNTGEGYNHILNLSQEMSTPDKDEYSRIFEMILTKYGGFSKAELKRKKLSMGDEYDEWLMNTALAKLEETGYMDKLETIAKFMALHEFFE